MESDLVIHFLANITRWAAVPLDEGSRQVIADGMQVLFERGTVLSRHLDYNRYALNPAFGL
jgi:hypothetical protein